MLQRYSKYESYICQKLTISWWWWWWWWWWIVFEKLLTSERYLALFSAGNIVRDPHNRQSLARHEQYLILPRTCVEWSYAVVITTTPCRHNLTIYVSAVYIQTVYLNIYFRLMFTHTEFPHTYNSGNSRPQLHPTYPFIVFLGKKGPYIWLYYIQNIVIYNIYSHSSDIPFLRGGEWLPQSGGGACRGSSSSKRWG